MNRLPDFPEPNQPNPRPPDSRLPKLRHPKPPPANQSQPDQNQPDQNQPDQNQPDQGQPENHQPQRPDFRQADGAELFKHSGCQPRRLELPRPIWPFPLAERESFWPPTWRSIRRLPGAPAFVALGLGVLGYTLELPPLRLALLFSAGTILGYWHLCCHRQLRLLSLAAAVFNGVALGLTIFFWSSPTIFTPPPRGDADAPVWSPFPPEPTQNRPS